MQRFLSVDPLADKYPGVNPYAYTLNNPVRLVDLDGMEAEDAIFDKNGNFLGTDSKGYTGNAVVMSKYIFNKLTNGGKKVLDHKLTTALVKNSTVASYLDEADLSLESISKILTHITKRTKGISFKKLEGGIINVQDTELDYDTGTANSNGDSFGNSNNPPLIGEAMEVTNPDGTINVTSRIIGGNANNKSIEYIQSVLGVHEYKGHGLMGIGSGKEERKAYYLQYMHKSTFNKLTEIEQKTIMKRAGITK